MKIRNQTKLEKEKKRLPRCLYDPLEINGCGNFEFPPKKEECRRCLTIGISDGLRYEEPSDAMRWFIAYRKFMKIKEAKQ